MPIIRDATDADIHGCGQLDLSYETDYVWQVDLRDDAGAIALSFRTARLPRMMRVAYPNDAAAQHAALRGGDCFLVAEESGQVRGYLIMGLDEGHGNAWITDIGVGRPWRRQKVGTLLLQAAYNRARARHLERLIIETQTKNYPGICFCQKNGLVFCGFNDRYYPTHDVALFFGQSIR